MTGERRDQLRAVFLAAIMALSVVAMGTAGLAGTAVADSSEAVENVDSGETFASIQAAIDEADPEDTIEVGDSYDSSEDSEIVVDESVDLIAVGDVVIDTDEANDGHVLNIEADDVTLEGFEIDGANVADGDSMTAPGDVVEDSGNLVNVLDSADNVEIIDNEFVGASGQTRALVIATDGHVLVEDNEFDHSPSGWAQAVWVELEDATIQNNEFNVPEDAAVQIGEDSGEVTVENNVIEGEVGVQIAGSDNEILDNDMDVGHSGINAPGPVDYDADNNLVADNTITADGDASDAIQVRSGTGWEIENNVINEAEDEDSFDNGILLNADDFMDEANPTVGDVDISDNDILSGSNSGINIITGNGDFDGELTIEDNQIEEIDGNGISIDDNDGAAVDVTGTTFSEAATAVHVGTDADAGEITLTQNNILADNEDGVTNDDDSVLDATSNWWGDASGPSAEGPGQGLAVSEYVQFYQWLDAEDGDAIPGDIQPDPETVINNTVTEVDVTIEDFPEDAEATFEVTEPNNGDVVRTGTTDDGTFSFFADSNPHDAGDEFDIEVSYDDPSTGLDENNESAVVSVGEDLDVELELDPEEPIYGDELDLTGSQIVDSDGEGVDPNGELVVEYPDGDTEWASEGDGLEVLSDGTISQSSALEVDDAGNYTVGLNFESDGIDQELGTFEVGSQEGELTFEADETPVANDGVVEFNVSVEDADGEGIDLEDHSGDILGYVSIVGNFTGDQFAETGDGNIERVVVDGQFETNLGELDEEDTVTELHVTTDEGEAGVAKFSAEPTEAGDISASLEVAENEPTGAVDEYEADGVGGVEDSTESTSFDVLDITADADSVEVEGLEDLNVEVTPDPEELTVSDDPSEIEVEVTGANNQAPGDDGSLDSANVTLESDDYGFDETVTLDEGESTHTFEDLFFDQAGDLTITVEGFEEAEEEDEEDTLVDTFEETLEVDGDILVDLTPQTVTVQEEFDLEISLTDADGDDVTDREIAFSNESHDDVFELGSGELESLDPSTYVLENVSHAHVEDLDLTVEDDDDLRVNVTEALEVLGDEAYTLEPEDDLLAGASDDLNITVIDIEDGEAVNDTDVLDNVRDDLEIGDFFDADNGDTVVELDAENGTIQAQDVLPDEADTVNMTATGAEGIQASGEVFVDEPEITTSLGDSSLTAGLTVADVEIEVEDPRDGEALENADLRFTALNATFDLAAPEDVDFDAEGDNETELSHDVSDWLTTDENGTVAVTIVTDELDEGPSSLQLDAATDGDWFGEVHVDAEDQQIFERSGGEDVDVRDEIEHDSEDEVFYVHRDANGDRLDDEDRTVYLNVLDEDDEIQETVEIEPDDDALFSVDYSELDLEPAGSVTFNVSNDAGDATDAINVATMDVTDDLEEVNLTLNVVSDTTVEQGEEFEFEIERDDRPEGDELTRGKLTFINETGEEVATFNTGSVDSDDYGVVDTADLDNGTYEVVAHKADTSSKTFLNDTAEVTVGDVDDAPSAEDYEIDGEYTSESVFTAIDDWRAGIIDADVVFDVIELWRSN